METLKHFLLAALLALTCALTACTGPEAKATEDEPRAEIERAVRTYFAGTYVSKINGLTLHRQSATYYLVGADVEARDGKRTTEQVIARRFSSVSGESYWLAESYNANLVEGLKVKEP